MESNKDEAVRCLAIARKHLEAGNLGAARKFASKSISLFETKEAHVLLDRIAQTSADGPSASEPEPTASTSASGAQTHPSAAGVKHRAAPTSSGTASESKREYTPAQAELVRKVRACQVTEYYEILSLKKDCEDADVKKAYKKLALQLHPDKNGAPGADEAFKLVSKAFQVLSDSDMRAAYDSNPSADPSSRFSGSTATHRHHGGGGFQGEVSPEDIFNMFFGGGAFGENTAGFGGPFGGAPIFTASFGGPGGFRTTQFGGPRRRPQQQPQRPQTPAEQRKSQLMQLAPLLILFLLSMLQALPSLFGSSPPPDPGFAFRPSRYFSEKRLTSQLDVPYYVNPAEFNKHSIYESIPVDHRSSNKAGATSPTLFQFESGIEKTHLVHHCQAKSEERRRKIDDLGGFLGIGADWAQIRKLQNMRIEECDELRRRGWA